jgi:hypothetical protein
VETRDPRHDRQRYGGAPRTEARLRLVTPPEEREDCIER